MSRAVRRVPMDWQHPIYWVDRIEPFSGRVAMKMEFKPLHSRTFKEAMIDYASDPWAYDSVVPEPEDYMPDFFGLDKETFGFCMYEEVSEGTPLSPVFATIDELARWLADHNASAFGRSTATYEQWLATCKRGWVPSAISTSNGVVSGVEGLA